MRPAASKRHENSQAMSSLNAADERTLPPIIIIQWNNLVPPTTVTFQIRWPFSTGPSLWENETRPVNGSSTSPHFSICSGSNSKMLGSSRAYPLRVLRVKTSEAWIFAGRFFFKAVQAQAVQWYVSLRDDRLITFDDKRFIGWSFKAA